MRKDWRTMQRLTESETETLLTSHGLPLWVLDQARMTTWHGNDGQTVEYDRGDGFYWVRGF